METESIRILLADDHVILRSGLKVLLEKHARFEIVGEASTGLEALALVEQRKPDLILLDLSMPGLGGLEALPTLLNVAPHARILILTMHDDPEYLRQALRAGAAGYVLKKAADVELISAIDAVRRGEVYIHSAMTKDLLEDLIPEPLESGEVQLWNSLSDREKDVLRQVAFGYTSGEIAGKLNLSPKTVDTYKARGMEKLALKSRAALVKFALRNGLMSAN